MGLRAAGGAVTRAASPSHPAWCRIHQGRPCSCGAKAVGGISDLLCTALLALIFGIVVVGPLLAMVQR